MATIEFLNGLQIEAETNGNCFIIDIEPEFPQDLSMVTVSEGEEMRIYKNADIAECASVDGRYWFAILEMPESVRIERQMQANIDYIAMVSGIDLEE